MSYPVRDRVSRLTSSTNPTKVVYIGAAGRSGSTLLGRLLGNLPGYVHVGEVDRIWKAWSGESILCGCTRPVEDCRFWSRIKRSTYAEIGSDDIDDVYRAHTLLLGRWQQASILTRPIRETSDYRAYVRALGSLYRTIAADAGAQVIVDSTKRASYARLVADSPDFDLRLIHLVRDSRAVAFSWRRWKPISRSVDVFMSRYNWHKSAMDWNLRNNAFHLCRPFERSLWLRYEDLIDNPRAVIARVIGFMGQPVPDLSYLDEQHLSLELEHTVGGNPGRFDNEIEIKLDDEWRSRIPLAANAIVTAETWPLLSRYGYF